MAAGAAQAAQATAAVAPRVLYPQLSSFDSGYLRVSELHTLYYEVYGNPRGVPAVVVHGGPGAGCWPNHARFFDPAHYKIILVDQRGCGRSTPYGCLEGNTTADLVNDLEQLRRSLDVQQWLMLGGSWGVTLTLAYAQAFPASVLGVILRGLCLMRPREIQWMFGGGAAALKPLGWTRFLQHLPPEERGDPLLGYYKRLLSPHANTRAEAAKAWSAWEMTVGFSTGHNVLLWDGQHWSEQATPAVSGQLQQQQQGVPAGVPSLPPPPQPMSHAAVGAAAAAAGGLLPLLHRDISGSSWSSTLQQQQECTTNTTASVTLSSATAQQLTHNNNATMGRLVRPRHRKGGASASAATDRSTHTTCSSDSSQRAGAQLPAAVQQQLAVLQVVQSCLQHRGYRDQGQAQALLEAHYSIHAAFLQQQPLLDHIDRVRHIPCIAVQGQWDLVCPPATAVELGQAWPEMELRLVPRAGHSMYDPAITHELVTATDRMRLLHPAPAAPPADVAIAAAALVGAC